MVSPVRLFILAGGGLGGGLAGGGLGGGLGSSSTQSFTPHLQLLHVDLVFNLFHFHIYSLILSAARLRKQQQNH